jgi:thiopurine S-methyltransferase
MFDEWIARWRDGRTAFHEGAPNDLLDRHAAALRGCRRVLVPLCGKAEDLAHLSSLGHDVLGVELAEQAVREFFAERGLSPSVAPHGPFTAYSIADGGRSLTLLAGDIFALTPELLGPIDAIYDRAALVALPAELRQRYVALLRTLVPRAPALVITYEYDQQRVDGPPFAVLESELRSLYAGAAGIEMLESRPAPNVARCTQLGIPVDERCFAIRP